MDDLISRQAAIDAIQNEVEPFVMVEPGTTCVIGAGVNDADVIRVLEQLPSAQPEIVHCEECAYRKDNFMGDWCTCWCGWTLLDGYCHKGANKDE